MGEMAFRHQLQGYKRCDMCHKAVKSMYFIKLGDDLTVEVCSGMCAENARANYQDKKDRGIKPGTPQEMIDDVNVDTSTGGEVYE